MWHTHTNSSFIDIDSEAMNKVKFFVNLLPFKRIPFVVWCWRCTEYALLDDEKSKFKLHVNYCPIVMNIHLKKATVFEDWHEMLDTFLKLFGKNYFKQLKLLRQSVTLVII